MAESGRKFFLENGKKVGSGHETITCGPPHTLRQFNNKSVECILRILSTDTLGGPELHEPLVQFAFDLVMGWARPEPSEPAQKSLADIGRGGALEKRL
jgi:hypothetical protein